MAVTPVAPAVKPPAQDRPSDRPKTIPLKAFSVANSTGVINLMNSCFRDGQAGVSGLEFDPEAGVASFVVHKKLYLVPLANITMMEPAE